MLATSLQQLRAAVRARTEKTNALLWLPDAELNGYLQGSSTEYYDLKVRTYEDYAVSATPFAIPVVSTQGTYPLPLDFYKSRGVEVLTGAQGLAVTIKQFLFEERNLFNFFPTAWTTYGFPNVRYRIVDQKIWFIPVAIISTSAQLWYIPTPPILVDALPSATWTLNNNQAVGDQILVSVTGIPGYTTAQSCVFICTVGGITGGTIPAFSVPGTTADNTVTWSYQGLLSQFATSLDTVSGWDEYVILDACIKVRNKEEVDASLFQQQLTKLEARVTATAPNRDAGAPQRIVDVHQMNTGPLGGWGDSGDF
jgi:hypothetical protein